MRTRNLVLHLANLLVALAVLLVVEPLPLVAAACGLVFMAVFALFHDVLHGALHLPRRVNGLLLHLTGAALGVSGSAGRRMHLVHHARPFAPDDLEGYGARHSLPGAILGGPGTWLRLPFVAWRLDPRGRPAQLLGWATLLVVQGTLLAIGGKGLVYTATAVAGQLTIQAWASWVPHRGPAWMHAIGALFDGSNWSLPIGLAHHELHHERPTTPTFDLPALAAARRLHRQSADAHLPRRPAHAALD